MRRLRILSCLGIILVGCASPAERIPATAPRNWGQARPATLPWAGDPYAPRAGAPDGSVPVTWNGPYVPAGLMPNGPQRPVVLRRPDPRSGTARPEWLAAAEASRPGLSLTQQRDSEPETLPVAMTVHVFPDQERDGTMLATAESRPGRTVRARAGSAATGALRDAETHPAGVNLVDDNPGKAAAGVERESLPGAVEADPEEPAHSRRAAPSPRPARRPRRVPQEPPLPAEFAPPRPSRPQPRAAEFALQPAEREALPAAIEVDPHRAPAERAAAPANDIEPLPGAFEAGTPRPRRLAPLPPRTGRPRRALPAQALSDAPPMPDPSLPGSTAAGPPSSSPRRVADPSAVSPPSPSASAAQPRRTWGLGLFRRWRERWAAPETPLARGELGDVAPRR